MWAVRQVISYLWSSADWIDTAGSRADAVPAVGSWIGSALHSGASYLREAAWSLYDFDQWIDSLQSTANAAYSNALTAYTYATGTVWSLAQSAYSRANEAYNYATGTVWSLAQSAYSRANEAYAYATGTVWSLAQSAYSRANEAYTYATGYLLDRVADAIAQAQSARQYVDQMIGSLDIPGAVIGVVASSMGYLVTKGFETIAANWETFKGSIAWLVLKVLGMVADNAASFADAVWDAGEAILKRL